MQKARVEELRAQLATEQFSNQTQAEITRKSLELETAELQRLNTKSDLLIVRSLANGRFFVPNAGDLPGRYFREGQVVGYVSPADGRIVRVVVAQSEVDLVRHRLKRIQAMVSDRIAEPFSGRIIREVPAGGNIVPSKVLTTAGGGAFAADPRSSEGTTVMERLFQFDIELMPVPEAVKFGSRVLVRFNYAWEPLAMQAYRRIRQLFLARFNA